MRPVGEARGQSLFKLFSTLEGNPPELVAGLPGGAPVPYALRSWTGDELIFHAYALPWD
ncbi:MAG: hypothetical protein N838_33920 [Thiohalocapsa sp. PB-PSB1]|nr:MAG: hypothetical protein N838_33920 [Thiohalocapsa sp. PB-PSB1]